MATYKDYYNDFINYAKIELDPTTQPYIEAILENAGRLIEVYMQKHYFSGSTSEAVPTNTYYHLQGINVSITYIGADEYYLDKKQGIIYIPTQTDTEFVDVKYTYGYDSLDDVPAYKALVYRIADDILFQTKLGSEADKINYQIVGDNQITFKNIDIQALIEKYLINWSF